VGKGGRWGKSELEKELSREGTSVGPDMHFLIRGRGTRKEMLGHG